MSIKQIRDMYKVPAKRDMDITLMGRPATIVGSRGMRLRVEFDDEPGVIYSAHPTWDIVYPGAKPSQEEED